MGSGDWNDGMNLVGEQGRGESMWLAFFLYDVLDQFAALARRAATRRSPRSARPRPGSCARTSTNMAGTARGIGARTSTTAPRSARHRMPSAGSIRSRRAGPSYRGVAIPSARSALAAVDQRLVRRDSAGPTARPTVRPLVARARYIKGYVPGVRENGGQSTHAAVWTAMALRRRRRPARVGDLRLDQPAPPRRDRPPIATYKVEPYVVAADVYTNPQHAGRGGWTWYTGSAGWMYRLVAESLLGIRLEVDRLFVAPQVPAELARFSRPLPASRDRLSHLRHEPRWSRSRRALRRH